MTNGIFNIYPLQSQKFLPGAVRFFCQTIFYTYTILARIFPGQEMPLQNSRLFAIMGTLTI